MTTIRNIGSYMVIKRTEIEPSFGDDVYYGIVKYPSSKSKVECIYKSGVTYLKKDIDAQIVLDGEKYDIVSYYNIILNFIYDDNPNPKETLFKGFLVV